MKEERINKRKIQAAKTKKGIFEAASQLAKEHGIENVSVNSIVGAAGVSKGTFYVHYDSKDALIVDLVNEHTGIADKGYKSFILSLSDQQSSFDIINQLTERIANYIEQNIGLDNMTVLYKFHLTKNTDTSSALNYSRELYTLLSDALEKGDRDGELRDDIPVDSQAKHLIMAIRGVIFEWCIRYPDFNLRDQLHDHINILLYGLKK